jgi:hypothetical protein
MHQADFERHVGRENICANVKEALERAAQTRAAMVSNLVSSG